MKKREGISLITLVITIIVVIILTLTVILTLTKNNSANDAKVATLLESKGTIEAAISLKVTKEISTSENISVKNILIEDEETKIINNATLIIAQKNDVEMELYKLDKNSAKEKMGIEINDNLNWYMNSAGNIYLVYENIDNVPSYMLEGNKVKNAIDPFLIILNIDLEEPTTPTEPEETIVTLTFDANGGTLTNNVIQQVANTALILPTPTRSGYTFGGWYLSTTSQKKVEYTTMPTANKTLYAKWISVWDGTVATSFASGTGTAQNPFIIETAGQLAYLSSQVNAKNTYSGQYIKVVSEIDLNNIEWTPIGYANSSDTWFKGNFDGGNNSILNLSITKGNYATGLFGKCKNSVIENVTIESGSINIPSYQTTPTDVGGIVARLDTSEISNCVNKASITSNSSYSLGGIVGYCVTGTVNTAPEIKINNCYNYGNITLLNSPNRGGAGIVGYTNGIKTNITSCGNYGNIYGENTNKIGGIASYVSMATDINKCFNEGNLYGKTYVGGILASAAASKKINLTQCYNSGELTAVSVRVAGITPLGNSSLTIQYCYNVGTLKSLESNRVSGISDSGKISNCYNTGSIVYGGTSSTYNGSIASYPATSTLYNCYYLKGTFSYGLNNKSDVSGQYEVKEEKDFTDNEGVAGSVVNLLNKNITDVNNIFVIKSGTNNGYPVFSWQ